MVSPMMKEEDVSSLLSPPLTVLVAVNGSIKSANAVLWALGKHTEERIFLRLLHVCPTIKAVPTPMGNYIPISGVRPEVLAAYKKDLELEIKDMFLSYKRLNTNGKVEMDVMVIEADDVPEAIAKVVSTFKISKLVIGESSQSWLTRVLDIPNLSSRICACVPSFCSVHVVSKRKVTERRPPTSETDRSAQNTSSPIDTGFNFDSSSQTGTPQFQSLSSMNKDSPLSLSSSTSNKDSRSAFVDSKDKKDALHSRLNNSDGQDINPRRTHSLRCQNSDWKPLNNYRAPDASPISSSLKTYSFAAPTPGTGIRHKETKQ